MKVVWCWRCRADMPMLEDDEWAVIRDGIRADKDGRDAFAFIERERVRRGLPPLTPLPADASPAEHRLRYVTAGYEMFTGIVERNANAVWHHVASHYGSPCHTCGKPLRTPQASFCAACGRSITIHVAAV